MACSPRLRCCQVGGVSRGRSLRLGHCPSGWWGSLLPPGPPAAAGAERLLRHLHTQGIPFCLATSSHKRHVELKTTNHREVFALFDHQVTGCQVALGKPAPDIFLTAAQLWQPLPQPSSCLVFEDAPSGVEAARSAGMSSVMVPDPQLDPALTTEADEVLSSLLQFQPERWGLPPFPGGP